MAGRKKVVADKNEALESISEIMRGDEIKTADKMKAAEYIVKYEDEQARKLESKAAEQSNAEKEPRGVMIVDDVPTNTDS